MQRTGLMIIAALAAQTSIAQQTVDAKDSTYTTLQQVVVSATHKARERSQTPYSIEVLQQPAQQIQQARTTPEALAYVPGVFVQKTNHGGGSPFLRGLTGNQTLIMIDGIRFNNATFRFGPNQYPNLIDAFSIDRIEVLKGSGSVQYGSDAMGGVIHVLTKKQDYTAKPTWHANATGRITTQDMEYTGRASAAYSSNHFMMQAGYTFRQFGDLVGGDTTGVQRPSGYDERDWDVKMAMQLSDKTELIVSSQQVVQRNVPLYHRVKLENFAYYRFSPQVMQVSYARLNWKPGKRLVNEASFTALYKYSKEGRQYNRNGNANFYDELDKVNSVGATAEVYSSFNQWWTANSGIEWYSDKVRSSRIRTNGSSVFNERGLYPDAAVQDNFSAYSLHHFRWRKWLAEAGLRYNHFINSLPGAITQLPGQPKENAVKLTPASLVGNASLLYNINPKHIVYASFSNGYRAPGLDDMGTLGLVDFRYEVPAYDLKPEKNSNIEFGYRFAGGRLQASATFFYMHINDLISRVRRGTDSIQGYPVYIKTNDQQAFVRGFEISAQYQITKQLRAQSYVAYQYGQNLTRSEPMRRIPPMNGLSSLLYQASKWYVAVEHQWAAAQQRLAQGDKDDNRIPKGGTPAWMLWNMHAGYQASSFSVKVSLHNISNEDYRTHGSGINGMGRALVAGVSYNF